MPMLQNVHLIWLDPSFVQDNSDSCRNTITELEHVVGTIYTFTDRDDCVDFLTDSYNKKAVMIVSSTLCRNIVPFIHDIAQVHTIFIFCKNTKRHEQWAKEWSKIKGLFTELSSMCHSLKQVVYQYEQSNASISFMTTSDVLNKKLDQLDCSFMYTQILKEILLSIKFEQHHIKEFIHYCRQQFAENESTLVKVKELDTNYHTKTPIWWYTSEYLLYSMLNRALRTMEVNIVIKMGFFLNDLHRHIEQLHSQQFSGHHTGTTFTVYRGQGMSQDAFEQMTKTKGGLMSFNNFLSTSKDHDVSLMFAESNQDNPDLVGILFVMTIDASKTTTPFASIKGVSCVEDEDEVLFSMHAVFRIDDIIAIGETHRLFRVNLTLTSDDDKDLRVLTDRMQEEIPSRVEGWERLGSLLLKLGLSNKAQEVFQILLQQTTEDSEKAAIFNQLGWVKQNQGEYEEARNFFEMSLSNLQQSLPPNHPTLAVSYSNIGVVYDSMGEYSKSLSSHEKALAILQRSLPPNHPDLASSYGNIGIMYQRMGEYLKALSSHEKALAIRQRSLPPNHPDLSATYSNICNVYESMGEYAKALFSQEKALAIQKQSLPPNHPALTVSYNSIGNVYYGMNEFSKALLSFEKSLAIQQQLLSSNHPDLAVTFGNIGNIYARMCEYSKALSSYEKALVIKQQSLPPNHPDLTATYNNIGNVCRCMGDYSKALSFFEEALAIQQQSLPPNHPDLAAVYNNIGTVYENMHNYLKARSFYERATDIGHNSLPLNHPHLQAFKANYDRVKKKL